MSLDNFLNQVMDAHGGIDLWKKLRRIDIDARCSGLALRTRFQSMAFYQYQAQVLMKDPELTVEPFPTFKKDWRGIYTNGNTKIVMRDSGLIVKDRFLEERNKLLARIRRKFWWDQLDALYFGGYALWNYLTQPLILLTPGLEITEIFPIKEKGVSYKGIKVVFPKTFLTHSPEQYFYFDERNYLYRHDYTALVFGRWAHACHYTSEHKNIEGLIIPTRRLVHPRLFKKPMRILPLVKIQIDQIKVQFLKNS